MIDTKSMRAKILDLAMRGQLTEQLPEDGTAEALYQKIQVEKQVLINAGKIKKEKPLPLISGDEIPFPIPNNWKWVRIGSILNLQSGKNIAASDIKNEPDEEHRIPCFGGNGLRGFVNQPNTDGFHAIIGRQGALCGNINYAEGPFYATEHAVVVYEYAGTDMNWVGITLRFLNLNQYATSVAQPGLAVNKIDKVLMPFAPLAEQQRIVEKINRVFSVLDTIDTFQAQYSGNLTVLKSKLIDAAIQGKLTKQLPEDGTAEELYQRIQEEKQELIKAGKIKKEKPMPEIKKDEIPFNIPANWKWCRLGEVITLVSGIDYKPEDYNDQHQGIPYITGASNLLPEGVLINRWTENPRCIANYGDVLLVCKGSGYGKVAMCDVEQAHIARQIMAIKKSDFLEMRYIQYFLIANFAYLKGKGQGLIPGVDRSSVLNMLFPLPPQSEQLHIVGVLDDLLANAVL